MGEIKEAIRRVHLLLDKLVPYAHAYARPVVIVDLAHGRLVLSTSWNPSVLTIVGAIRVTSSMTLALGTGCWTPWSALCRFERSMLTTTPAPSSTCPCLFTARA